MKKYIIGLIMFINLHLLQAQEIPLATDRPDQTESAFPVPEKCIQLETGFALEHEDFNSGFEEIYTYPSMLFKYGLFENFELRLIIENTGKKIVENNQLQNLEGINPIVIGFKSKICEENGLRPKTSFIAHLAFPKMASQDFKADYFSPEFRFTMQHTFGDKISLGYNLGMEWGSFSARTTGIYTATLGFGLSKKTGFYIEVYGFLPENYLGEHYFDGGLTFLVKNNLQLDFSGGFGLNNARYFAGTGISFRLPK